MSKIFANENPQNQAPAPAITRSADAIHNVANLLAILFGVAIAIGVGSLLYHYWKFALAFLMAIVVFACGSSRAVAIGCMCILLLMLAIIGHSARAQTVVDGDTIKLNGTIFRIWGIDAAETRQVCRDGWMAGKEASKAMLELLRGHKIACEAKDKDRYGRTVALCRADGRDLGAALVSAGMAWAFTRYSSDYVGQERTAIGAKLGVHGHDCEKPWDWRRAQR
jgi:endonuclease YncB( thermonuclease family)